MRAFTKILILLTVLFACKSNTKRLPAVNFSGYDLNHPEIIQLPKELAEISGLAYDVKDSCLFAIEDENGILYKIALREENNITKWRFDKKRDFEDLVLVDNVFYVLISNGDIETVQFITNDSLIAKKTKFPDADKKQNEFESLYFDDSTQQLILLCKNCEDDGNKKVTAWGYNLNSKVYNPLVYEINVKHVSEKLNQKKIKIRPSATAINPITNELYILASQDHLLLTTDRSGKFLDLFELDPGIYKQAEGIAFTPWGDLIISNESSESGSATILKIKYKIRNN
jgi:uncharacterized protein YjiK